MEKDCVSLNADSSPTQSKIGKGSSRQKKIKKEFENYDFPQDESKLDTIAGDIARISVIAFTSDLRSCGLNVATAIADFSEELDRRGE